MHGFLEEKLDSKWQTMYFALKDGYLCTYKSEADFESNKIIEKMSLENCEFNEFHPEMYPLCFEVQQNQTNGKCIVLKALSMEEMYSWLTGLLKNKFLSEAQEKPKAHSVPPSPSTPSTMGTVDKEVSTSSYADEIKRRKEMFAKEEKQRKEKEEKARLERAKQQEEEIEREIQREEEKLRQKLEGKTDKSVAVSSTKTPSTTVQQKTAKIRTCKTTRGRN